MTDQPTSMEGGCTCGAIRYRLNARPLFVHCCHCTWCQRETGSAFAVNALIEASNVQLLKGSVTQTTLPTASGKGQIFSRCPTCGITLWSNYAGAGNKVHFVRTGTLTIQPSPRRTSTSTHSPSGPGSFCPTAFPRSSSTIGAPPTGLRRASRGSMRHETRDNARIRGRHVK